MCFGLIIIITRNIKEVLQAHHSKESLTNYSQKSARRMKYNPIQTSPPACDLYYFLPETPPKYKYICFLTVFMDSQQENDIHLKYHLAYDSVIPYAPVMYILGLAFLYVNMNRGKYKFHKWLKVLCLQEDLSFGVHNKSIS